MQYKYGSPNEYGDFPYLYAGAVRLSNEETFRELLMERLPKNYPMQIVDHVESEVLTAVVNRGIDSHLEACSMTSPAAIEDRKIGDRVVQRHLALGFDRAGMVCLIRRLKEFNLSEHEELAEKYPEKEYGDESRIDGSDHISPWDAAYSLVSSILETLQIEYMG